MKNYMKIALVMAVATMALVIAAPANASYTSHATKAAVAWGKHHHPGFANRVEAVCQTYGYHKAFCQLTFRGGGNYCQTNVTVKGYFYTVRRRDSTC